MWSKAFICVGKPKNLKKKICQDNGKAMKKLAQSLMKLSAVHRLRQNFRMELKFTFPVRSQRFLQPSTRAEQLVSPRHLPECRLSRNFFTHLMKLLHQGVKGRGNLHDTSLCKLPSHATTLKQCRLREQPGRHSTPTGLCTPQVGISPRNWELYNQCICSRRNNNVHSSDT